MRLARTAAAVAAMILLATEPALARPQARTDAPREEPRARAVGVATVAPGLNGPAGFTFSPDGRIWYLERGTGQVRVYNPKTDGDRLFFSISNVDGDGERGALGIALHPRWPMKPFVFVYVTRTDHGRLVNELLRIRNVDRHGQGVTRLFKWPVGPATNHNGGRILFGADDKLWVVTGENAVPSYSQQRANLRGKILRINPDGSIPRDNPYRTRVWAYGIRNSFGMALDPKTGRIWESDNGPGCNDEINLIVKAGNFAWGPNQNCAIGSGVTDTNRDGPAPRRLPKRYFRATIGITGMAFCTGCRLGAAVGGDLLFGDVNDGNIRAIDLNDARTGFSAASRILVDAGTPVYSMEVGPHGRIYFSGPNAIYRLVMT